MLRYAPKKQSKNYLFRNILEIIVGACFLMSSDVYFESDLSVPSYISLLLGI